MFPDSSRCFELLVRLARGLISIVDSVKFAISRLRGRSELALSAVGNPIRLRSGPNELEALLATPAGATCAALLILPGIGDRMAYWRRAQATLAGRGIASLVFHYSGHMGSEGRSTPEAMERDAHAAYAELRKQVLPGTPIFALGFSLGSGIAAEVARHLEPAPAGIIISQPYTSFRAAARRVVRPAPWLARLLPRIWDSAQNVCRLTMPLLIVHAEADRLFPVATPQDLAAAARDGGTAVRLALIPAYPHNAVYLQCCLSSGPC